jgi:hypothetical protein
MKKGRKKNKKKEVMPFFGALSSSKSLSGFQ